MVVLMHSLWPRLGPFLVLVALTVMARGSQALAATSPGTIREHEVKAAAFYNILGFTEWPATSFASPETPLVIGVLGQGPVASLLEDLLTGESWRGHRIVLRRISTAADAKGCHVVYIAVSERAQWRAISHQFYKLPILTIGDSDNFAAQGGVVQLGVERNRLHLIVNLHVARAGGLVISSKVLRLAQVIDERSP
jgi:hypothetical protein